jgi:uncharacterized membrane protein YgcG
VETELRTLLRRLPAILLPLLLVAAPALGQPGRSLAVERFHAEILVRPDGMVEITETLRFQFQGRWKEVFRNLSLEHRTASGWHTTLRLGELEVTDENGTALPFRERRRSRSHEVTVPVHGARDTARTVVIRYTVANPLRFFDDGYREGGHDELYWNVTGNDWEVPIRQASAHIRLPPGAQEVEAWAYTGRSGSTARDAVVEVEAGAVNAAAIRGFAPREGLTVSVVWAPGAVNRAAAIAAAKTTRTWLGTLWVLVLPGLAFAGMFRIWRSHGERPRQRSLVVRYEPPAELTPTEIGTLVDHAVDSRDITATLIDLAVRGYMLIEEKQQRLFRGLRRPKDYVFHLRKPPDEWGELAPHERLFLDAMFRVAPTSLFGTANEAVEFSRVSREARRAAREAGQRFDTERFAAAWSAGRLATLEIAPSVELSKLRLRFSRRLELIGGAVYQRLIERGLYRKRPDRTIAAWQGLAFALLFGAIWAAAWWGDRDGDGLAMGISVALAAAIVGMFARRMGVRTEAGIRTLEEALGFRKFLRRVDGDRLRRMVVSPDMFERYLPHAVAFGVERRWGRAFDGLYTTQPTWYQGGSRGGFRTRSFGRSIGHMASQTSRSMGGSRSGAGGGGRSGGGSGGGGGGGR